jgi:muramoyltetrapeptide carboxypeptidase
VLVPPDDVAYHGPQSLRRPRALAPGDRVAVLSVSSPVRPDALEAGLAVIRLAGLDPVVYPTARLPGQFRHYLAGSDEQRAAELTDALTDPSIAGIVFAAGGYGAQRTLEVLDWPSLTALAPKVLAGYSDVTAILEAVGVRLGWSSVLGAMVAAPGQLAHASLGSLLRLLMQPGQARQVRFDGAIALRGGRARGVTMGGNLSLLAASAGTATSWPARGGILLLEDHGEADYRIDRLLTQLRRSGYLDGVAGVITGTFTGCGERAAIEAVLTDRLGDLGVPVLARAAVGHGGVHEAFAVGIAAELDAGAGTLTFADAPLRPRGSQG